MTDSSVNAPSPSIFQRWGRRGTTLVLTACALVLLLIGASAGLVLAPDEEPRPSDHPTNESVDAGFLRDMSTHHTQAVAMAYAAQADTENDTIKVYAYDMEYTQISEIGTMRGWLVLWDLPTNTLDTPMGWMGSDAGHSGMGMNMGAGTGSVSETAGSSAAGADVPLMPGMATNAEMAKLKSLRGQASDIFFLQLMIRHHQGGAPMMQYAADHAENSSVRQMAQKMLNNQTKEIAQMTDWLTDYNQVPLPFAG